MTPDEFREIFSDDDTGGSLLRGLGKCNVAVGLNIITKYLPSKGIEGADHDIVYSVAVGELADTGITEDDALVLHKLNWHIKDDHLACFV